MESITENQQTRRRAVRLKKDAIQNLKRSLQEEWNRHPGTGRLTRDECSRLLGVSLSTSEKILKGKGVDRPTLTHVYKKMGLPWDDAYCEPLPADLDQDDLPAEPASAESPPVIGDAPAHQQRRPRRWILAGALAGTAVLLISGFHLLSPRPNNAKEWEGKYLADMKTVMEAYQRADYIQARSRLTKVIEFARFHSDALALSETLMRAGDLAAANGDYETAKAQYEKAMIFKNELGAEVARPMIWNALGEIETALNNYQQAELYFRDALREGLRFADLPQVIQSYRGLGTTFHYQGDLAEEKLKGMKEAALRRDIQARKALVWRDQGLYQEAMASLQECLAYWQSEAHPRWIARTQLQIASVHFWQSDRSSAASLVDSSLVAYANLRDQAGIAECKRMLEAKTAKEFGLAITSTSYLSDDAVALQR